jgi:hypothetical protein
MRPGRIRKYDLCPVNAGERIFSGIFFSKDHNEESQCVFVNGLTDSSGQTY